MCIKQDTFKIIKLGCLVGVSEATHTGHDAEDVVVAGVDNEGT